VEVAVEAVATAELRLHHICLRLGSWTPTASACWRSGLKKTLHWRRADAIEVGRDDMGGIGVTMWAVSPCSEHTAAALSSSNRHVIFAAS
jgi:hypothetical protein